MGIPYPCKMVFMLKQSFNSFKINFRDYEILLKCKEFYTILPKVAKLNTNFQYDYIEKVLKLNTVLQNNISMVRLKKWEDWIGIIFPYSIAVVVTLSDDSIWKFYPGPCWFSHNFLWELFPFIFLVKWKCQYVDANNLFRGLVWKDAAGSPSGWYWPGTPHFTNIFLLEIQILWKIHLILL